MKTLYISDLDGTLLRSDKTVSAFTRSVLSRFVENGGWFTVCSSRSLVGLKVLHLDGLALSHPAMMMNGAIAYDMQNDRIAKSVSIPRKSLPAIYRAADACGLDLIVHERAGREEHIAYRLTDNPLTEDYIKKRIEQVPQWYHEYRRPPVHERVVYLSVTDRYEMLLPFYEALQSIGGIKISFYPDCYSDVGWFLEVFSEAVGKDTVVERLKRETGAERVVVFGDNRNDLPMFEKADYRLAVANGTEDAKKAADAVIDTNDRDGVARYLAKEVLHWESF